MPELLRFDVTESGPPPLLHGIFLGWLQRSTPYRSMILASLEDSVAVLGPPRVGKTSGVLIPQVFTWPGSVITASTKADVLHATRGARLEVAVQRDGDVYIYSPTDPREVIDGVRAVCWSPIDGCEDAAVCEVRVQKMLGPQKPTEQEFFRQSGAAVIRGYFHAAALAHLGIRRVKLWIDSMDVDEAVDILNAHATPTNAAGAYVSALEGIGKQGPETKAGTFGTVSEKLAGIVGNAAALTNADKGNFDVDRFLQSGSTLYIVSPEDTQAVIAPLVAGLVESVVSRAYNLALRQPNGRLDPPLLLSLDEVGAIAPLQSLPAIMGQGASQGVLCVWAAQSFNQLKARWGDDWARSILGASSQKLIFGGLVDTDLLEEFSRSFGEYDRRVSPHGSQLQAAMAALAKQGATPHLVQTRRVKVDDLHKVPPGQATLVGMTPNGPACEVIGTPPAFTVEPFATAARNEAWVQSQIGGSRAETPDVLREQAIQNVLFGEMPRREQDRFLREQQELNDRITKLQRADRASRDRMIASDPGLGREQDALEALQRLAPLQQAMGRREILQRFADAPQRSFTYTGLATQKTTPPQDSKAGSKRSRLQPRAPDTYHLKG